MLICLLHSDVKDVMPVQFCLLRMPLYFLLSGLFFKDYGNLVIFIEKKLNKIFIPAIFFYTLGYIVWGIYRYSINVPNEGHYFDFVTNETGYYNGPIWFLFCLFNINILFCCFYVLFKGNKTFIALACALCGLIGYILSVNETRLILFFDVSLTSIPFFFCGWFLRNTKLLYDNKNDNILVVISLCFLISIFFIDDNITTFNVGFNWNKYNDANPILFFLLSIATVVSTLLVLKKIKWLPFISYMGRYSLIVLGTHVILTLIAKQVGDRLSPVGTLVLTYILCWFTIPLIKEYLPYFSAQKDCIKIRFKKTMG